MLLTNTGRAIAAAALVTISIAGGFNAWATPTASIRVANNAALQAITPTTGAVDIRDGYFSAGDGGQATYIGSEAPCTLNLGAGDNGSQVAPKSGTGCWNIAKQARYDARIWGVVADYNYGTKIGTDNTTTLGYAISAVESTNAQGVGPQLVIPDGAILTGPQLIYGQVSIIGQSSNASVLVLKSGSSAQTLTILPVGYNFPSVGWPSGQINLDHLRFTSVDGFAYNTIYPNAGAINMPRGNKWPYNLYANDITIYNMPGDGIEATVQTAAAYWNHVYVVKVGGVGISTSSTQDWVFDEIQVSESQGFANVSLSGDGSIYYHNLNSYAAANRGVTIYGRVTATFDGHNEINLNGTGGFYLEKLASDSLILISDTSVSQNSQSKFNTTADYTFSGGSGIVKMLHGNFYTTYSIDKASSSSLNVYYINSSKNIATCVDCNFANGSATSTATTNDTTHFLAIGPLGGSFSGGITAPSFTSTGDVDVTGLVRATRGFVSGSMAGISCSGPPSPSFTVTNGIVTHC